MFINPSPKQQQDFMQMPDAKPLYMVNLLKFKADGGEASYLRYSKAVGPLLEEVGGTLVWAGKPMRVLIGPEDETLWDLMLIVKYPDKMALAKLGGNPDYPGHLRAEGLEDSRLIACTEFSLG